MTITDQPSPIRNGVDTAAFFATLDAVKGNHDIADFQWRVSNTWISGTHNRSTVSGFYGATQEMTHRTPFQLEADHPAVLVGEDQGPTPVEYVLHALASCLTAGIANIAAARKVNLTKVTSTLEGDMDLLGILGLADDASGPVRNGFQQIRVRFQLEGDTPQKLQQVVEQSRQRSAVYDLLTNGVPIAIDVDAG
ncbi:MAG: OsmC family protein [Ilumatobacteraceae bacterium]